MSDANVETLKTGGEVKVCLHSLVRFTIGDDIFERGVGVGGGSAIVNMPTELDLLSE